MPTVLPPDHPERELLAAEVHARPPELVETPARATYVAVLVEPDDRARELAHVEELCRRVRRRAAGRRVDALRGRARRGAPEVGAARRVLELHLHRRGDRRRAVRRAGRGAASGGLARRRAGQDDGGRKRPACRRAGRAAGCGAPRRRLRREHGDRLGGRPGQRDRLHRLPPPRRLLALPRDEPALHPRAGGPDASAPVRDRGLPHARPALVPDRESAGAEDRRDRALACLTHAGDGAGRRRRRTAAARADPPRGRDRERARREPVPLRRHARLRRARGNADRRAARTPPPGDPDGRGVHGPPADPRRRHVGADVAAPARPLGAPRPRARVCCRRGSTSCESSRTQPCWSR